MNESQEILFSRFLAGVLQSPIPDDEGADASSRRGARRAPRLQDVLNHVIASEGTAQLDEQESNALRRGVRRRVRFTDIETILHVSIATGGTAGLKDEELAILRSLDSRAAIARRLRQLITDSGYLDSRLANLFSDSTSSNLLVPMLLVVLQHRQLAQIPRMKAHQFRQFKTVIALSTVIKQERIPPREPEHRTIQELQSQIRTYERRMAIVVNEIVENTKGFFTTHQRFIHSYLIHPFLDKRVEWNRQLIDTIAYQKPPTELERLLFDTWQGTQDGMARIDALISRLQETQSELAEQQPQPREVERVIRSEIRRKKGERRQLNWKGREIKRRLGNRFPMIQEYVARESRGLYNRNDPTQIENCHSLLRELDQLLAPHTNYRLWQNTIDDAAWARCQMALEKLIKGEGSASLEFMIKPFLEVYGRINNNRNIGLVRHYTAGTYTGHGENAIDINAQAKSDLSVAAPSDFRPPDRLFASAEHLISPPPVLRLWENFLYQKSVISAGGVYVSTDLQDIFGKLTYLLHPRTPASRVLYQTTFGQQPRQRLSEAELIMVMRRYNGEDLAPEYLSKEDQFDVWRILAGLAFGQLTETPNAGAFDEMRKEILLAWEELIAEQLRLSAGTILFDRDFLFGADVGAPRLVASARQRRHHGKTPEQVGRSALAVLRSEHQRAHDYDHWDGLVHQIWRLLVQLYSTGNVELHHRGQSVTIQHIYESSLPGQPNLVVEVFYTHLFSVNSSMHPGRTVGLGALLGQVGETGNAFTPHLHLEIKLSYAGRLIGTMLPHEFFPLMS